MHCNVLNPYLDRRTARKTESGRQTQAEKKKEADTRTNRLIGIRLTGLVNHQGETNKYLCTMDYESEFSVLSMRT